MIFVAVGNADPFDRLLQAMDQWMEHRTVDEPVFAQIGNGTYLPRKFRYVRFLGPDQYLKTFAESRFVVAHAGMGSIITAIEMQKLIVLMPKLASLGEQRNEHQLATVRHFNKYNRIRIARNEQELPNVLDDVLSSELSSPNQAPPVDEIAEWPPDSSLIQFIREFVKA